jgi:predicted dehydrogenase
MKIGTVGTNFIVGRFIEAARATGEAVIAAAYSRSAEQAVAFAGKHGVPGAYCDRDAFLSSAGIDCVYVAAPNSLHYQWARAALDAGKNVICEKPFTSNAAELESLIETATKKKRFLFEAITVPHLPNFRLIREKLPEIGPVRCIQMNFSQYSSRYRAFLDGKNPNVFNPAFSGGALMDINYYNLCFIWHLLGDPESIRYTAVTANGIDVSGVLVMKYRDCIACAVGAKDSESKNCVQIQGEDGYIYCEGAASNLSAGFEIYARTGVNPMNPATAREARGEHRGAQDDKNVLRYELCDFAETVRSLDYTRCHAGLEASLACARLLDRARKDAGIVFPSDSVAMF